MHSYELYFIVYPEADEEELTAIIDKITQTITANGGQVTEVNSKGKRKLAYPIRKFKEGRDVVMQTQLEFEGIQELERSLKLSEPVIRYLLVRTNE
ncbi:MAG: 30S ribosomal protein S6 [Anaerolineales bacterium]|nr:MAG: 30S ribosomal protein S6 [Anaerolineales bacterium]